MRAHDFIIESELKTRDFYERYRLQNLIRKLEQQEPFTTVDGQTTVIPASRAEISALKAELKTKFDPKDTDPKARNIKPVSVPTSIGGVKLSTLLKTKEFGGKVGGADAGQEDFSKANLGPTIEALKSFAIYAKLTNRDKDVITPEDVLAVGKKAFENSATEFAVNNKTGKKSKVQTTAAGFSEDVPDKNKTINDNMTLKVALSTPSFRRAVQVNPADKAAWGNLQGILSYVNTETDIAKYSRFFANNNKRDPVKISVVGIGGAKTDIATTYVDPTTGAEKPLKNLSLSIKSAGAEWYDQASAGNVEGMSKFYNIIGLDENAAAAAIEQAKFIGGGKADTTPAKFAKRIKAVNNIYAIAYNQLKARIPQLNDAGEADYIHNFVNRLKSSLAGDERLIYVKFDADGTYKKLNPTSLAKLANLIELDVNYTPMRGDIKPKIFWIDKNTGQTIIYVTLLVNAPNFRLTHQFNLGKDFFNILNKAIAQPSAGAAKPGVQTPTTPATSPNTAVTTPGIQNKNLALKASQKTLGSEPAKP